MRPEDPGSTKVTPAWSPMTSTSDELSALRATIALELDEPVRPNVAWLASEIATTHGEAVLGVLFYGSGLRDQTDEGVLDFWVVVDDYPSAYENGLLALANRVAPPNVFYLEREHEGTTLRTKYGVIDRSAFEKGTSPTAWHPYIWARFSQPARLLVCRDDEAKSFLTTTVANAVVTAVSRLVCLLPARGDMLRFSLSAFWQEAFRRTYDSERRPEAEDSIRGLYLANAERYDRVATQALLYLASEGHFTNASAHPRAFSVELSQRDQRMG